MKQHCPWCREPLPSGRLSVDECPHCARPLVSGDGSKLRLVDVHYERVAADQKARFRRLLLPGCLAAAAVTMLMPVLQAASLVAVPLVLVVHLVVVRLFLVRDAFRLLGKARRLFVRWIARLAFLWVGLPGYAASAVPVIGLATGPATFAALTVLVHRYVLWSLGREKERRGLTGWEKLLLAALAALTIAALVVLLALAALLGWSTAKFVEIVSGG
jgi:hypothetical protein